jgi:hypothetical protein
MKKASTTNKTEARGGAGRGQGRKQKYGEPTVQIRASVPESKVNYFEALIERELKKLEVNHG